MSCSQKSSTTKYVLDCTIPVNDKVLDLASFVKFLQDRIKVNGGKAGVLGDLVKVETEAAGTKVAVTSTIPMSKRYLKYLTKKYLKKQSLRDYIRIVASDKKSFKLSYYPVDAADEE
mmetsp:Transcript_15792/g.28115  ORF Transcript_15792/g.28115 Transcript_15792/m.28115 type:complete len:117 (-) Transcript_15792:364-714(-)|eukprot:CAMPEP_0171587680 /NCGR_PEP_ID=MMETSP0961-20121227/13502_1 /TAXON_ID=87120 /ORGANISM="Aurantiochytrium limacinum, Strain ATCCMYA-1381" /LENGTH=116 /DNA_ID=CAMNT_0012146043 /DNA_START=596 /DNA_END=946 /DNA_ORIENTATION=+